MSRKKPIQFSEIEPLGFQIEECNDAVFEKQYGMKYRIITKQLTKRIVIYYHEESKSCEVLRLKSRKGGTVTGRMKLNGIEQVKAFIKLYQS